jgi:acyl carrier protein
MHCPDCDGENLADVKVCGTCGARFDPDQSRRSPAEAEEIRRLVAWNLCGAMPPNDTVLRELYADGVTLDSLGVDSLDPVELSLSIEEKFGVAEITPADQESWKTVGDIIAFVKARTER